MNSFPGGSDGKESPCNAGDLGSIPGKIPGGGNGNLYSCLENPHGQRSLVYSPQGCKESDTTEATEHYSHEVSRVAKFTETKSRMVVTRGC